MEQAYQVEVSHVDGHLDQTTFTGPGASRIANADFEREAAHMAGKKSIRILKGFIDPYTQEFIVSTVAGRR